MTMTKVLAFKTKEHSGKHVTKGGDGDTFSFTFTFIRQILTVSMSNVMGKHFLLSFVHTAMTSIQLRPPAFYSKKNP